MSHTPDQIVRLCRAYAGTAGIAVSTASRRATGSGATVSRLQIGRDITTRRAAEIVQWLSDHWPASAAWPTDIPRPAPTPDGDPNPPAGGRPHQPPSAPAIPAGGAARGGTSSAGPAVPAPTRSQVLAQVVALRRDYHAAAEAGDWPGAQAVEARMIAAGATLDAHGRVASPAALCEALGIDRAVYDYVVRQYAHRRRSTARVHRGGPADRLLRVLRASGDARFPAASVPGLAAAA